MRVYSPTGDIAEVALPGVAWAVSSLANGDIVVGCAQAGTSKQGHVYTWTRDAGRVAGSADLARMCYERDMVPPSTSSGSSDASSGGGGTGGGGSGGQNIKVTGPYEAREAYPGASDGQYGFFKLPNGQVMVCAWSTEAGCWADIGTMEGGDAQADDPMSGGSICPSTGRPWDYDHPVTIDTSQGVQSMHLRWNEGDDSYAVATAFCDSNGIGYGSITQIQDFIIAREQERALVGKKKVTIPSYKHFPASVFIDHYAIDWKKVWPKLVENNAAVAAYSAAEPTAASSSFAAGGASASAVASLALSPSELDQVQSIVTVLEQTTRYHATTISRPALRLLLTKCLAWPTQFLLPVADVLRMVVLHSDGADALAELAGTAAPTAAYSSATTESPGFGSARLIKIMATTLATLRTAADARGVVLTLARFLFNCFRHASARSIVLINAPDAIAAVSSLAQHEHATCKFAAAVLAYNIAAGLMAARRDDIAADSSIVSAGTPAGGAGSTAAAAGGASGAAGSPAARDAAADQLVTAIGEALLGGWVAEEDPVFKLVMALGTLACIKPQHALTAKALGLDAPLAALLTSFPGSAVIREAVVELRGLLAQTRA